ncbi:hypothetical protein PFISCL1PPCAC_11522, partial [Pristionchus fissidentatus]
LLSFSFFPITHDTHRPILTNFTLLTYIDRRMKVLIRFRIWLILLLVAPTTVCSEPQTLTMIDVLECDDEMNVLHVWFLHG